MKEIKAYIRHEKAEDVIFALEAAGVPGCTAIVVKAVGASRRAGRGVFIDRLR